MSNTSHAQLIQEHRWLPLVFIPHQHQALVVTPGVHPNGLVFKSGWLWHWPVLTSVIEFSRQPYRYRFDPRTNRLPGNDQNITAVSRDHHLLTIEGHILIEVDFGAPTSLLSRLNRHTHNRIIRPIIRQVLRTSIGQLNAHQCTPSRLQPKLNNEIREALKPHGLTSSHFTITSAHNFTPEIMANAKNK